VRQGKPEGIRAYRFDGWELNLNTRRLMSPAGQSVPLSNGEFSLLVVLLGAPSRILSRDQLLDLSGCTTTRSTTARWTCRFMRLRRKIEKDPAEPRYIRTEKGRRLPVRRPRSKPLLKDCPSRVFTFPVPPPFNGFKGKTMAQHPSSSSTKADRALRLRQQRQTTRNCSMRIPGPSWLPRSASVRRWCISKSSWGPIRARNRLRIRVYA